MARSLIVVSAVLFACLLALSFVHSSDQFNNQDASSKGQVDSSSARTRFQLPRLFNFELYKQHYSKSYASIMEELARRKLVLARAFRAMISSIKYKLNQSSSYYSLNPFSDQHPSELFRMKNKLTGNKIRDNNHTNNDNNETRQLQASDLKNLQVIDTNQIESELKKLATGELIDEAKTPEEKEVAELLQAEFSSQLEADQGILESKVRSKRDLGELEMPMSDPQTLAYENMFNGKNAYRHLRMEPPSYEPQYSSSDYDQDKSQINVQSEPAIRSLLWSPIGESKISTKLYSTDGGITFLLETSNPIMQQNEENQEHEAQQGSSLLSKLTNYFKSSLWVAKDERSKDSSSSNALEGADSEHQEQTQEQLPDEVFVDHRESGCIFPPRNQGSKCASSYAFATTTLMEWLSCKNHGKMAKFSEQYIIDCGRLTGSLGCEGGKLTETGNFVSNYGLELASKYSYRGFEQACPYDPKRDTQSMGFIRMRLGRGHFIPVHEFAAYLPMTPIGVSIELQGDFHEYGGGVYESRTCEQGDHLVVIIGHGREDNREYWLVKNSYGLDWGEQGYIKLSKEFNCIVVGENGFAFGKLRPAKTYNSNDRNSNPKQKPFEFYTETTWNLYHQPGRITHLEN